MHLLYITIVNLIYTDLYDNEKCLTFPEINIKTDINSVLKFEKMVIFI